MPFDGNNVTTPAINRARLIEMLREEEEQLRVKYGWSWNFDFVIGKHECGSAGCAIGIAQTYLGFQLKPDSLIAPQAAEFFGLSLVDAQSIFNVVGADYVLYGYDHDAKVTPGMVADRLEKAPYV